VSEKKFDSTRQNTAAYLEICKTQKKANKIKMCLTTMGKKKTVLRFPLNNNKYPSNRI
jgi:hypothetical protein